MTTLRDPAPYWGDCLSGKSVLITGGLGFIGSSLALQLAELGANVDVLDALIPEYGGNWFNVAFAEDRISATIGDIRDAALVSELVQDQDLIIHGAAQVSHVKSLADPFPDIDINIKGNGGPAGGLSHVQSPGNADQAWHPGTIRPGEPLAGQRRHTRRSPWDL